MAATPRTRKLVGALGFILFALASTAVGVETLGGVLLGVLAFASWLIFAQVTLAELAAKAAAARLELRGIPRAKVARAVFASWLIPGAGHLVLGWSRQRASLLAASFLAVAAAGIGGLIPVWAAIVLAGLPWLTAQAELHYRTGWRLLRPPGIEDVFPPDPEDPPAFAHSGELSTEDPRRGWRGRA